MIGIAGGYGDIGLNLARILETSAIAKPLIGGRNSKSKERLVREFCTKVPMIFLDLQEQTSVEKFVKDCSLVINCTGKPGNLLLQEAYRQKCHYIDLGELPDEHGEDTDVGGLCMVGSAGSIPGLSALLPLYLANMFDHLESLEQYYAALGRCTYTAAKDYLDGLLDFRKKNMVCWENGREIPYVMDNVGVSLPLSNGVFKVFPYLDEEAFLLIKNTRIKQAKWFVAVEGQYTLSVLEKARGIYSKKAEEVVERLCKASLTDCTLKEPYGGFVTQLKGNIQEKTTIKTLVLKCDSPSKLTALVAAVTAASILKGEVPSGRGSLGQMANATTFIPALQQYDLHLEIHVFNRSIEALMHAGEGEL